MKDREEGLSENTNNNNNNNNHNSNYSRNGNDDYDKKRKRIKTRVWVDGCFDLFHYGHANALRQSKGLADQLIVGCHSDQDIRVNKGPTVLNQSARCELLSGCRWVDEVVPDAPYSTELEFIKPFRIDFVAHGDDITTDSNGLDSYRFVKRAGIYKEFKRTIGVSTTDTLSKILSDPNLINFDRESYRKICSESDTDIGEDQEEEDLKDLINLELLEEFLDSSVKGDIDEKFIKTVYPGKNDKRSIAERDPTTRFEKGHLISFIRPVEIDHKNGLGSHFDNQRRTIYVHGPYDLFSVEDLRKFKELTEDGKFNLLVGIWSDGDIKRKLRQPCIWNFQERALSVLQCKFVTGLILPAISPDRLNSIIKTAEDDNLKEILKNLKIPKNDQNRNGEIDDDDDDDDGFDNNFERSDLRLIKTINDLEGINRKTYLDRQDNKLEKSKVEQDILNKQK